MSRRSYGTVEHGKKIVSYPYNSDVNKCIINLVRTDLISVMLPGHVTTAVRCDETTSCHKGRADAAAVYDGRKESTK